jgi:universal stress protein A
MQTYKTVVVAVDLSLASEAIVQRTKALVEPSDANLMLLHVVDSRPSGYIHALGVDVEAQRHEEAFMDAAKAAVQRLADKAGLGHIKMIVRAGLPREEIVRLAEEECADLIVLGSHGIHGIRHMLGSTSDAVLQDAPCDVLAIRIKH